VLIGGHLRPRRILLFHFLSPYSPPPNDTPTPSPSLAAHRASPISFPLTFSADFRLVVVSIDKTLATQGQDPAPLLVFRMLLTGAATVAHQCADNLNNDAGRVSGTIGRAREIGRRPRREEWGGRTIGHGRRLYPTVLLVFFVREGKGTERDLSVESTAKCISPERSFQGGLI